MEAALGSAAAAIKAEAAGEKCLNYLSRQPAAGGNLNKTCEKAKGGCERLPRPAEALEVQHKMDTGQLCSILAACMSTNPEQRKAGETTLEQVVSPQLIYCSGCLEHRRRAPTNGL